MTAIKIRRKIIGICLITITLAFTSCNSNVVYSKYEKIDEKGWKSSNKLNFEVEILDSIINHDVYLTIRHDDAYQFNNLFVFLTTTYPNGKQSIDTIECVFADAKGKWQGDGAGDLWDNKIALKKNVKFPYKGKYQFTFEQGMRVDPLPLIWDFGMVIEKSKN
jgi:gliding motility-associated lipoprotein GldH